MNLLEIRTSLAVKSGRYDLVDPTTFADNGMNFHINAGQIYLEGIAEVERAYAHLFKDIATDEYSIALGQKGRTITSVWGHTGATRFELEHFDLENMKTTYDTSIEGGATGQPAYYAHATFRILETLADTTLDNFVNLEWPEEDDTKYEIQGLIIFPPADGTYTITTSGDFLPRPLLSDTDTNYWATNYPHVLEMAALRSIEVFNRNTAGVRDWTTAIRAETVLFDFDVGHNYDTDYTACD